MSRRTLEVLGGLGMSRSWTIPLVVLLALRSVGVLSQGGALKTYPVEKDALLAFKKALVDPAYNLQTWDPATDPCMNWSMVFCDVSRLEGGTTYKHVTELRMFVKQLSGELVPELGNLTYLSTLDVMWNQLTGGIPPALGNLANLIILALNGNRFRGSIPEELGKLTNMNRIQLDENYFSGPIPSTFGNLSSLAHLHLNNNSFTGSVPPELGSCPGLIHILLDNNKLSGALPPEIANANKLVILQLDNNQFDGGIPSNYTSQLSELTKLSCRNCNLSGPIPDLSNLPYLYYVDLSNNSFTGQIPRISLRNITTIDFSRNQLRGPIPSSLQTATELQTLQLSFNNLNGSIPDMTNDRYLGTEEHLLLDFQNNSFEYVSLGMVTDAINLPQQIDLRLSGNKEICVSGSAYISGLSAICRPILGTIFRSSGDINYLPRGGPIIVKYRLKSPSFTVFTPEYESGFSHYLADGLRLQPNQVQVQSYEWQYISRLLMVIVLDPPANSKFNSTEVSRIQKLLANWNANNNTLFGPYELLDFVFSEREASNLSKGAISGIAIGSAAVVLFVILLLVLFVLNKRGKIVATKGGRRSAQKLLLKASLQSQLKITGVKSFSYKDLAKATDNFSEAKMVGRGGYGKVYRGILESGQVVAIKRANFEAIQRNTEFYNEIELLSRCHHRNLVALVGYCNDEEEQMLVYEFMEGGTLHQRLHADAKDSPNFITRLKIALQSAKGILYLHTEADPPIFHRDIKSTNILLDNIKHAKVADFGLSRLAPDFHDDIGDELTRSHVSTVVKGTPGYLDPEYFLTRKLTDKSDVYSFGVVLLELITGMQPISYGKNIVREVKASFDEGTMWKAIDQNMGSYPSEVMDPFVALAMSCVDNDTNARPTMKEVTRSLESLMLNVQGKYFSGSDTMDIQKDDFSVQMDKKNVKGVPVTGFDTGSSQNSKSTSQSNSIDSPDQKDIHVIPR